MKIAITGNIGSGKSEAIKFLSSIGYKCISSDQIIKSLYQNNQSRDYILKRIGVADKNYKDEIIKRLANPLFNQKLKKVIYPLLYAKKKIIAPKFEQYAPIFMKFPCYLKSSSLKTLMLQYLSAPILQKENSESYREALPLIIFN
jgi:dephospho-CoA kinase